jgi:signal transduction histidine kinase
MITNKELHSEKARSGRSASVIVLLLGSIIGTVAMVFAVIELNNLYHHQIFPELESPKGHESLIESMTDDIRRLIHTDADLHDPAKMKEVVEPEVLSVFLQSLLITDAQGTPVYFYTATNNSTALDDSQKDLRESHLLDDTTAPKRTDDYEGAHLEVVYRGRQIRDDNGKLLGALVLHRALYPIPEKLAAIQNRLLTATAILIGALAVAFFLVISSALALARRNLAHEAKGQRLEAMSRFASTLAHEVKNPLNALGLTSHYLAKLMKQKREQENTPVCETHDEVEKNLGVFKEEMDRVRTILTDFLDFARPVNLRRENVPLKELLQHLTNVFGQELKDRNIALDVQVDDGFFIYADKTRMLQVLMNLVKNASEAIDGGGKITVTASRWKRIAEIRVRDTGRGMAPEQMVHLFEPYYTTKAGGQGLGLPISKNIIESHGGTVSAVSFPGEGTTFTLTLPLSGPKDAQDKVADS